MANDSLKAALAAFQAETHGRSEHADAGLDRLLAGAEARTIRRMPRAVKWLPLAAALAASSAWAALGTDRVASLVGFVTDVADPPTLVQTPIVQRPAAAPVANVEPAPSVGEPPRITPPLAPPAVAHAAQPSTARAALHHDPQSVDPAAQSTAPPQAEPVAAELADARAADTRDFKAAYRRHDTGSPASSIAAFDGYLAAHPNGRFVPEARYARAVALVRAGRTAEARRALAAFADAPSGSYRREDAARVLRTLEPLAAEH